MSQIFNGEGSGMVVYLRHDWMLSREVTRDLDLGCRVVANLAVKDQLGHRTLHRGGHKMKTAKRRTGRRDRKRCRQSFSGLVK
jgi:hypothetical protein